MTKCTDPNSFPGAISDIIDLVGKPEMCAVSGRAERTQNQWADPETPTVPNLRQALALDALFIQRERERREGLNQGGVIRPPILTVYQNLLEKKCGTLVTAQADYAFPGTVLTEMLDISEAVGCFSAALRDATTPTSPAGVGLSEIERKETLRALKSVRDELDDMEAAIRASDKGAPHV